MTAVPEGYGAFVEPIGDWTKDALCTQVDIGDIFYPEGRGATNAEAKAVCRHCPISTRRSCLDYAMSIGEINYGVWGGLSVLERRAIAKGTPVTPCQHCHQDFVALSGPQKYCSRTCAGKQQAINDGRVKS